MPAMYCPLHSVLVTGHYTCRNRYFDLCVAAMLGRFLYAKIVSQCCIWFGLWIDFEL